MVQIDFSKHSSAEIQQFLEDESSKYKSSMLEFVNLATYAQKIHDLAKICYAEDEGKIVGLCAFYCNSRPRISYLTIITINGSYRGQGIGRLLMKSMIDYCKQQGSAGVQLDVTSTNAPAVNLYKSLGFKVSKEYHSDKIDDLRYQMTCVL